MEIEIGRRLRQVRKERFFSRNELARTLEVHPSTLMRIEVGAMPLSYGLGAQAHWVFEKLNPLWLATGEGQEWLDWPIVPPLARAAECSYNDHYSEVILRFRSSLQTLSGPPHTWKLTPAWSDRIESLCEYRITRLGREINEIKDLLRILEQSREQSEKRKCLQIVPTSEILAAVKFGMENLLSEARHFTQPRGQKKALAKALHVSQSRVSEWLSGECEPDGRKTLLLLNWVLEQRASQEKRPAGALTPAEQKTRSRSSNETKSRPSPPHK